MARERCYVESDGRVYLVPRGDALDLPFPEELPFAHETIAPLATPSPVQFCVPKLDKHPAGWPLKDELVEDPRATALVRAAIQASMPRVVVEGICTRGPDEILLVRGSRGYTKGHWTLPGGFVRFGELPEEAMAREVREELGVDGHVGALLTVRGRLGLRSRLHWLMLFYRISIDGPPRVDPDEIEQARWFPRKRFADQIDDALLIDAIEEGLSRIG
jgi:ADP-ribose pyrophosphatase YjhB (NUDIX family)